MRFRFVLIVLLFGVLSTTYAQQEGGILEVAVVNEPTSLDPITTNNVPSSVVFMQIHDALVTYDKDLTIIGQLATDWTVSGDGLSYTFNLRDDVTFHNGEPFTSEDVKYAFETAQDPQYQSQWLGRFEVISSVETPDEHTVVINLTEPNAAFIDQITFFGIPSKAAHEEVGAEAYADNPVGTGPFRFVSWERGNEVVVERNEDYWLTRPNLDGATFRAIPERSVAAIELESGDMDLVQNMVATDVVRLQEDEDITIDLTSTLSYYYLAFNTTSGPLADARVRQALLYAIPMTDIVNSIFQEVGAERAYTSFAPNNAAYDPELVANFPEYNPERAKALLAEAGYPDGFSTTLYTPTDSARRQLGELLQAALSLVGVQVEVQSVEFGTLLPLTYTGDAPMWILGWTSGTDPNNYAYDMFHSDPAAWEADGVTFNTARYSNPRVDELLEQARALTDMEARIPLYHEIARIVFLEDVAHIAAYHQTYNLAYQNTVHDVFANPNSRIDLVTSYNNVWIEGN